MGPPSEPPSPEPTAPRLGTSGRALAGGFLGGGLGRLATNNLTRMAASLQANAFKPDLSLATARGLMGASAASASVTYSVRTTVTPALSARLGETWGVISGDALAGALGALPMHIGSTGFFLREMVPPAPGFARAPSLGALVALWRRDRRVFLRGLPARVAIGAADWSVYFGVKKLVETRLSSADARLAPVAGAVAAMLATIPPYQIYVRQLETGEGFLEAGKRLFGPCRSTRAPGPSPARSFAAFMLFAAVDVLDKVVTDGVSERVAGAAGP